MKIQISEEQYKILIEGFSYIDDFGKNREPGKISQNRDIAGSEYTKTIIYKDRADENYILLYPEISTVRMLASYCRENSIIFPKIIRVGSINRDGKLFGAMFFENVNQSTFNVYSNKLIKAGVSMKGMIDFITKGYQSAQFKSQRFDLYTSNKEGKVSDNLIEFYDSLIEFGRYVRKIKAEDTKNIVDWDEMLKLQNFGIDDNGDIKIEKIQVNPIFKPNKIN